MKTILCLLLLTAVTATSAPRLLPPVPPKLKPGLTNLLMTIAPAKTKTKAKPARTAWRSPRFESNHPMRKPLFFHDTARRRVFFGPLPAGLLRAKSEGSTNMGLHCEIYYQKAVPVYWPAADGGYEVIISDVVSVDVYQQGGYGAVLEYTADLIAYAVTGIWGVYPFDQVVGLTWIHTTQETELFYPIVFFRANKTEPAVMKRK